MRYSKKFTLDTVILNAGLLLSSSDGNDNITKGSQNLGNNIQNIQQTLRFT